MDHMMHPDKHQQCGNLNQPDAAMATAGTRSSAGAGVSQVAFVLAAVAFLSLISSSLYGAAAAGASSSSLPSSAALSARLAALCGFVTTKKALFVLSNAIFLFLAADCRCFFSGVCSMATTSTSDDVVMGSELPTCGVQAQPCSSYSGRLYAAALATPKVHQRIVVESKGLNEKRCRRCRRGSKQPGSTEGANMAALEMEQICDGVAKEELEKLEINELNRKFEDFIQSRRIKWLKEEEEQVLQCQQQQIV